MNFFERQEHITELLKECNGSCTMNYLCKKLYSSRSTIRRDLLNLEEAGIIVRSHGSIKLVADSSSETSEPLRKMINQDKKMKIAKLSQQFIKDDMVIFLDSSSTVNNVVPIIHSFKNITIITNGLNIASQISNNPNIKCYICPGIVKNKSMSIVGGYSYEFLNNFRADLVFFSVKSISTHGLYEGDDSQGLCKKIMLKNSSKKILLCDTSKEFTTGYYKLCYFDDIDVIISDNRFSAELSQELDKNHVEFIFQQK